MYFSGSVAVGYFGNEEGNKGIQSTVDAIQDTNDTISGSLATVGIFSSHCSSLLYTGIYMYYVYKASWLPETLPFCLNHWFKCNLLPVFLPVIHMPFFLNVLLHVPHALFGLIGDCQVRPLYTTKVNTDMSDETPVYYQC